MLLAAGLWLLSCGLALATLLGLGGLYYDAWQLSVPTVCVVVGLIPVLLPGRRRMLLRSGIAAILVSSLSLMGALVWYFGARDAATKYGEALATRIQKRMGMEAVVNVGGFHVVCTIDEHPSVLVMDRHHWVAQWNFEKGVWVWHGP